MLGAATVVSIYAVGHERTRDAAARLAEADAAHQRPAPAASVAPSMADTARAVSALAAAARESTAALASTAVTPKAPSSAATKGSVTAAPARTEPATPDSTRVLVAAAPVVPPPAADSAPTTPAPPATSAAPAAPKWRDGTFSGWGNSRHGSIEATVTIKNGRISDAYISRCETRYSCSWIEHLQIQVVDRQSPDVDFVSGATQSVNAFYYAVVEALLAAKAP